MTKANILDVLNVIKYDLGCLSVEGKDNNYHLRLAKSNLKDVVKTLDDIKAHKTIK